MRRRRFTHVVVGALFALLILAADRASAEGLSALAQAPASALDPRWVRVLEVLGAAYATDIDLRLTKLEIQGAARLGADTAKVARDLEQTLGIGHAPEPGWFETIPLAQLKPTMNIEMGGNRDPGAVLRSVLQPGNTIVAVSWHLGSSTFGDITPVGSYAIFSPRGELLFDTMLSLPVVRGPMFSVGHP